MSRSITVQFTNVRRLPTTRDGDFLFRYSYVNSELVGEPDEASNTQEGEVLIGISRSLVTKWKIDNDEDLTKVLFEHVKRHVRAKVDEDSLAGRTEIQLTTVNSPDKCPYDPKRVKPFLGIPFQFAIPSRNPLIYAEPSSLASQIIDLRDSINAIFDDRFHGRLLFLLQERHLLDLFRPCNEREDFVYRVASIGGLATAINSADLKKLIPEDKRKKDLGALDVLGLFLRDRYDTHPDKVNIIMDTFQNLNRLRRMYPIHIDQATGVLAAYKYFDLDYPVQDYEGARNRLLGHYRDALGVLLTLLKLM